MITKIVNKKAFLFFLLVVVISLSIPVISWLNTHEKIAIVASPNLMPLCGLGVFLLVLSLGYDPKGYKYKWPFVALQILMIILLAIEIVGMFVHFHYLPVNLLIGLEVFSMNATFALTYMLVQEKKDKK